MARLVSRLTRVRAAKLLSAQVLAHLSVIPMFLFAEPRHYVVALTVYLLAGGIGMSAVYHRFLAHRSWPCPRWLEILGSVLGTYCLTGSPLGWVAVHRSHHIHADEPLDPHSPRHGFLGAHYLSMRYRPSFQTVPELIGDPVHRFLHRRYWEIHICIFLVLLVLQPLAVVYAYLFPAMLVWNAGSAINSIGHLFGYRNFSTSDNSRNNLVLGYLAWGEGWHNNHHGRPANSLFSQRWFELDWPGLFIQIFKLRAAAAPRSKHAAPHSSL